MGIGKSSVAKALKEKLNNSIYIEGHDGWNGIPFILSEENKKRVLNNIINMINCAIDNRYDNIILG